MEDKAPPRRSVAELAGKFKGSIPAHSPAAGNEADKPVRRRPPRTLQLPKPQGDNQELPAGPISPLPAKAKRNSALIEKLQANLALSPSAPSPKSPGFRMLPPAFAPPSPSGSDPTLSLATPTSPVIAAASSTLTEEEGPASFEAPPTAMEGSILPSINKGRARHSIRRRPPSRRHRMSSSGDEVGNDVADAHPDSPSNDNTTITGEGEGGGGGDGQLEASTPLQKNETNEDDKSKISNDMKEGGEKTVRGDEGGGASSEQEEEGEGKTSAEKQNDNESATNGTEEETSEEVTSSAR